MHCTSKRGPHVVQPGRKVDTGFFWRKLLFQARICLYDPKGVDPDPEESDLVDGPVDFCLTKPWRGDDRPLMARLLPADPSQMQGGWGWRPDGHTPKSSCAGSE